MIEKSYPRLEKGVILYGPEDEPKTAPAPEAEKPPQKRQARGRKPPADDAEG